VEDEGILHNDREDDQGRQDEEGEIACGMLQPLQGGWEEGPVHFSPISSDPTMPKRPEGFSRRTRMKMMK
jgi:hypothetical protein